jgi:hypothetical protein
MYARQPTWLALFLSLMAFLALARLGHAAPSQWQEVHAAGVDVRLSLQRDAKMQAELRLTYRVVAGTLRAVELDVAGMSGELAFDPQGTVAFEDGSSLPLFVVRDDKGKLHLSVDDAKGLKRGNYTFIVHASGSAVADLRSDGAFLELAFHAPAQREGIDGMRIVFDLPSAPTEPQAKSDGAADDAILSTLRRTDRDELELVRPHVGRGEAAVFRVRVDRKALTALTAPALQAPPPVAIAETKHDPALALGAFGLLALALVAALRGKLTLLASRRIELRSLLPIPTALSPYVAALAFVGALVLQLREQHVASGALVALALLAAAVKVAPRRAPILAPGTWTPASPTMAAGALRAVRSPFDATRAHGLRFFLLALALVGVGAYLARGLRADAAWLVLLDGTVLVPLFFTGTESQLGPTVARTAALLERCRGALARTGPVSAIAHVPRGATQPDEVRLLTVPPLAMPGVVGIELGVAWEVGTGAPVPRYGVLVRVLDDSAASAKLAAELRDVARPVTGRRPEERVYALWPRLPLAGAAVGLVGELADVLRDRRKVIAGTAPWSGAERRLAVDAVAAAG